MYDNIDNRQWKYNYACAVFIVVFNLGLIITCRALLDSKNDFDEPLLKGMLRDHLELFLLYFSLTFCFGCCFCFCCLGKCFVWIGNAWTTCFNCDLAEAWTQSMHRPAAKALRQQHEQIDAVQSARKYTYAGITLPPSTMQPAKLSFGKPISVVPVSSVREFIV